MAEAQAARQTVSAGGNGPDLAPLNDREYWAQNLANPPDKAVILAERKTPAGQARALASHEFAITGPAFAALERLHNNSERRLHMILAAAVALLVKKYTGRGEFILGTPVLRQEQAAEFINTVLPLRVRVEEDSSFKALILGLRDTINQATLHQNHPLRLMLEQAGLPPTADDFPLFEIALLLENIHDQAYIDHLQPRITFAFRREEDHLAGRIDYDANRYDAVGMARLAGHFACLLERATADVNQRVADLDPIPEDERQRLLREFNATAGAYPAGRTVAELFAEQAAATPDAVAVVHAGQSLTFAELDRRSNRLAHHLRGLGVGPETVAAVLLEPCLDLVTALMGVMKADGAFLPLDPGYPAERIRAILDGSGAVALISDSQVARRLSFTSLQGLHRIAVEPAATPARPVIKDLDRLPMPDRSLVDYDRYAQLIGQGMVKNTYINLLSSRGCPFGCAYCHKIWPRGHQRRSAENIFAEIKHHYDLGVRRFIFVDDCFNLDRKASAAFFRLVLAAGLKLELFFSGGLRGDLLDPELIDLMVEAGTVSLALALETASPRLQKFIGKNLDLERFHANISYLCAQHPQVVQELFLMHGFPTETEDEAWQTIEFLKGLHWVHMPYLNILRIYANTEMERLALAHGVSAEAIFEAEKLAFYEIPDTLPFAKGFTAQVQSEFLNNYFLLKDRLLRVLPHQAKLFSETEIVQKYDSYLPVSITSFAGLLNYAGIDAAELGPMAFQPEDHMLVPDLGRRLAAARPAPAASPADKRPLRVLLLDLSQHFSNEEQVLYDVFEPPLGLMYLLTHLKEQLGGQIDGRIYKSRVDFDSLAELKQLYAEFQPDVIGVRALTLYKDFFHRAIAALRQWGFAGPLIAGGPYATSGQRSLLQDANLDLAVIGEGELTLAEVIEAIMTAGGGLPDEATLTNIAGIAFAPGGRARSGRARPVLMLDQAGDLLAAQPASPPAPISRPDHLAYIIYTSGSTGEPKGIMEEQEAFVDFVTWSVAEFEHRPGYQVLLSNSYASAGAIQQIFPPLITGGTLHLIDPDLRKDVPAYVDYLRTHRINNIDEVPVILNLIFNLLPLDDARELLPDLTCLSVGSEYIPIELIRQCRRFLNHHGRIINAYGQAEAASETATYHFDGRDPDEKSLIGRPRRNLRVYVLDPWGHLCPIGVPGELCVSGLGLSRGYLNRPELTAAKFAANPHSGIPGDRLYHTGDYVRWLFSGNIEFLGRIDHQVQVRGYRVELAEIEHHLRRHARVKDVVVNALSDERGETTLCAYYVAGDADATGPAGTAPDAADLRTHLAAILPDYMIPAHFLRLNRLPLNPNGKVDRKALPRPAAGSGAAGATAPRNDLERRLAAIWAPVLDVSAAIGIDDNFFTLGGHSLKTTLLKLRIHKELGLEAPLREIFQRPTIRGLAEYLSQQAPAAPAARAAIPAAPERAHYPLSLEQERLFTMQQFAQDFVGYNLPAALVLSGPVDHARLEAAFNALVARHAALRTAFGLVDGAPAQYVLPAAAVRLAQPRRGQPPADAATVAAHLKQFIRPFDLARPPLMRLELMAIDPALAGGQSPAQLLLVDMPHIVSDGISVWVLVDELSRLYAGASLDPPRLQYTDYAVWQRQGGGAEVIAGQRGYWLDQFAQKPPRLELASDFPRPAAMDFAGAGLRRDVPPAVAAGVRALAQAESATPYMVLLAAYFALLHAHTGQADLVVGSPTAGRSHADLEHTVGMFVNMLALRGQPRPEQSFRDLLAQVRETALGAFQHQDYQFVDLVRELNLPRDPGRNPLFDAVFELINISLNQVDLPGATVSSYAFDTGVTPFELLLVLTEDGERLDLELRYATALYKPETAAALAADYLAILSQVVVAPETRLAGLKLAADRAGQPGAAGAWDRSEFDL
ncbi:MAG: condensation domain-containing protein [Pseudomonadota bacterium]